MSYILINGVPHPDDFYADDPAEVEPEAEALAAGETALAEVDQIDADDTLAGFPPARCRIHDIRHCTICIEGIDR